MTFSGIAALIAGVVTAGCAIAGIISGIRARKAAEKRAEEMRRAEHEARIAEIKYYTSRRRREVIQTVPVQQTQSTQNGEVHHYYHYDTSPQPAYTQPPIQTYQQPQQNPYPSTSYAYSEPVYRGEQEIAAVSRAQFIQNLRNRLFPQYQQQYYQQPINYYPQANYAYAL